MFVYRYLITLLLSVLLACPVLAFTPKHVAITTLVDHPSLDNIHRGIENALTEHGYRLGKDLIIDYKSAQGNSAIAAQIARQLAQRQPDVIVPLTTSTAQAIAAATKRIPIVFVGITDPIAAKLIRNWKPSGTNITGISDALPIEPQIKFMRSLKPDLKTLGYIYSPGEINSTAVLRQLHTALAKHQIELIAVPAQRSSDVLTAARSLIGKVDMIYTTTDNNVVSSYEGLVKVSTANKIPLIASDPDSVKRGAAAALAIGYYEFGKQAGQYVIRILEGEAAGSLAPKTQSQPQIFINPNAAAKQGLLLSHYTCKTAHCLSTT